MALPCPEGRAGRLLIEAAATVDAVLRLTKHVLVGFTAGTAVFGLVSSGLLGGSVLTPEVARVALADSGGTPAAARAVPPGALVSVQVDGLSYGAAPAAGTVRDALSSFGIAAEPSDRISQALDAPVVAGMRIAVGRGFPVTLIDGGRATIARSQATTVRGFLSALAVPLSESDSVAVSLDRTLAPGDVVKVVRVHEREVTEVATYPWRVRYVDDPGLDIGRQVVAVPGANGEVSESHLVRYIDGVESDRTLLSTVLLRAPVTEVRRVGTRLYTPPMAPAEIERIIRAAATTWGADATTMLRVAWCESRYDPNAYNPRDGDSGLFQFIPTTWAANSVRAGYPGVSVFDPVANANVAAYMFARGSNALWTCK